MFSLITTLIFAIVGGILPALIWLAFWLREDEAHPEPNKLIVKTFFLGMAMVPIAFVLQNILNFTILGDSVDELIAGGGILAIVILAIWAFIEELVKYLAARSGGLRNKANDEPIDVPIYMITAALGFAALENILFLISPLLEGNLASALMTGNMRFIGATLLHVSSSAMIGIFGSLSYFFKRGTKRLYLVGGFVIATVLHTVFNLFIINHNDIAYFGFITVWFFVVLITVMFEKIKKIKVSKIKNVQEK